MLVEKTFIKVLPLVFSDTKKLKSYRKDKRISQSEKKIIESWLLVKLGKNKEAIELLESLKGELSEVVQGQLYLLKAFCSLNLTAFSEAIVLFKKAEPLINKLNLKRYNFSLYYNLHETYSNIGDTEGMKWCHQLILDNISTDVEKKSYEMALASLYLKLEDTKSAFKALNTIK